MNVKVKDTSCDYNLEKKESDRELELAIKRRK